MLKIELTEKELLTIKDTDFLLTKGIVTDKIYKLFELTRAELKKSVENSNFSFPEGTDLLDGKISKGEYYRNLPYLVLDYPAQFSSESVFAFRTMFWWGNFFSATLHLEGVALNSYRDIIANNLNQLLNQNIYIGVGESPWQYHYGEDNYVPLRETHVDHINECRFLKLSKKIEIDKWNEVTGFTTNFFETILSVLKTG